MDKEPTLLASEMPDVSHDDSTNATVFSGVPCPLSPRAVRCGRRKCVEFILWQMGADTEIADYGGFTPVLNTGKPPRPPGHLSALGGGFTRSFAVHTGDKNSR